MTYLLEYALWVKQDANVKVFNMIAKRNEAKSLVKQFNLQFKSIQIKNRIILNNKLAMWFKNNCTCKKRL